MQIEPSGQEPAEVREVGDTAGTTVVITGTDLDPASVVDFGGVPSVYTVNSATQITATAPVASIATTNSSPSYPLSAITASAS